MSGIDGMRSCLEDYILLFLFDVCMYVCMYGCMYLFKGICFLKNASPQKIYHYIDKFHFKTFSKGRKANFNFLEKRVRT